MAKPASGDPLAWPGALAVRLALLVLLLVFVTLISGAPLASIAHPDIIEEGALCLEEVLATYASEVEMPAADITAAAERCLRGLRRIFLGGPLLLLAALVASAVALYAFFPAWIRRRERSTP